MRCASMRMRTGSAAQCRFNRTGRGRYYGRASSANHPRHFGAKLASKHLPGKMLLDVLPGVISHPMPLATLPEELGQVDREIEGTVRHTEISPIDRAQLLADLRGRDHRHSRSHRFKYAAVEV